jgi:lysine 2,3-aminomutase
MEDGALGRILKRLRRIRHVEIIRIGTRVPCTLPQRVTRRLADLLRQFHPVYVNTHFNHPAEVTQEAERACARLADAGIGLGCQTVLLKGVNDDARVMTELMRKLAAARVRPYYLFQADLARGTAHFWTPLQRGLRIMEKLQGHTSGLCVPHFAVDLPGGGGKVRLVPESVVGREKGCLLVKNYEGSIFRYPETP